jgi:hypothetical protein
VSGVVTYQGNPLRGGTIHFLVAGNEKASTWIRGDGTFSLEVPVGVAKVAIETESVKSKDKEAMLQEEQEQVGPMLLHKKKRSGRQRAASNAPPMVYTPIPEHYSNPDKSGWEAEIVRGEQVLDFPLVGAVSSASK